MKTSFLYTVCSILVLGCVSAGDHSLAIEPAASGVESTTNENRTLLLRQFGVFVEANCNALLESGRADSRITVEGITGGFAEEGSSNTTMIALSVFAKRIDTNLVQTVREGVRRAMKRAGIGWAEVAIKRGQNQPTVHTITVKIDAYEVTPESVPPRPLSDESARREYGDKTGVKQGACEWP